jgi:hypothetical protein
VLVLPKKAQCRSRGRTRRLAWDAPAVLHAEVDWQAIMLSASLDGLRRQSKAAGRQ